MTLRFPPAEWLKRPIAPKKPVAKSLREHVGDRFVKHAEHDQKSHGNRDLYHGTQAENVQKILDQGFRLVPLSTSGNLHGPGLYLTTDKPTASTYGSRVLRVSVDGLKLKTIPETAKGLFPKDATPEEKADMERRMDLPDWKGPEYMLAELWGKRGYDGLMIEAPARFNIGSTVLVFDPSKAKVLGVEKAEGLVYYVVVEPDPKRKPPAE